MQRNYKIVTSIWFIIGLTLLLVNDFMLKGLYGNVLTGKLSDFAGLFIFPLFWTALLPKYKTAIFWTAGLIFIFWKSSYSQSWIELWNSFGILTIYRTIDYSDLIALIVLPLAYKLDDKKEEIKMLKINPILPLCIAVFAFMATSYRTNVSINKSYQFNLPKFTVLSRLEKVPQIEFENSINFTDTINFRIPSAICNAKLDVTTVLLGNDEGTTLTLINARHHCPSSKKDRDIAIQEFEKLVIEKLNDSQK